MTRIESIGGSGGCCAIGDTRIMLPSDWLEHRETLGTLLEAVAELPGVHGDVVRRHYFGEELLQCLAVAVVELAAIIELIADGIFAPLALAALSTTAPIEPPIQVSIKPRTASGILGIHSAFALNAIGAR